jgi:hypothetical protein
MNTPPYKQDPRFKKELRDRTYRGPVFLIAILVIDFLVAMAYEHRWFSYEVVAVILSVTALIGFLAFVFMLFDSLYVLADSMDYFVSLISIGLSCVYVVLFFTAKYAIIYQMLGHDHFVIANNMSFKGFDFFYFSVITICTLGYGDIVPASTLARLTVTVEILTGVSFLLFFLTGAERIKSSIIQLRKEDEKVGNKTGDQSSTENQIRS